MTDSKILLKLMAMGLAKLPRPQHSLDLNSLAIAVQTTEAWHLYIAFRYDTSTEGGIPGNCSIVLPEAGEEDVLKILTSGMELGGYRLGEKLDLLDLTHLFGTGASEILQNDIKDRDPLHLASFVGPNGSFDIRIVGSLIGLRGKGAQYPTGT